MPLFERSPRNPRETEEGILPTYVDARNTTTASDDSVAAPPSGYAQQQQRFSTNSTAVDPRETHPAAPHGIDRYDEKTHVPKFGAIGRWGHHLTYRNEDPYGPRPTFKEWWQMYWHDFLALFLQGMLSLGLLLWSPLPTGKYFAVTVSPSADASGVQSEVYNPEFAHPKMSQHIPILADAALALGIPFLIIALMQIRIRSFWDLNNAVWGTIYSVMTACMIQIIVKLVFAGLRPNFLTVCRPSIPEDMIERIGSGFGHIYFNTDICTNPDKKMIANSMQSFPSGHSAAAWAGLTYGALYVNAKLKVFANTHTPWVVLLFFWFQLLVATCIVGTLLLDMSHNWYDILAGSLLGALVAASCYRITFASLWDYRTNHIPLPRVVGRKRGWKRGLRLHDRDEVAAFHKFVGVRWGNWGERDHFLV